MNYLKPSLAVSLLLAALGCAKNEPEGQLTPAYSPLPPPSEATPAPQMQTQTESPIPPVTAQPDRSAIADGQRSTTLIATARCEREVKCNNVGAEGKYVTQEDCVVSLEPATRGELDSRDCPPGVSEVELKECTEEIKQTDCDRPVQNIDLIAECSNEELCLD